MPPPHTVQVSLKGADMASPFMLKFRSNGSRLPHASFSAMSGYSGNLTIEKNVQIPQRQDSPAGR
jgi:hypothetical protein